MIDIRPTLLAKSDQLNADDLIGGPMTIAITDVRLLDAADQPVAIHWEGGEGRPFKPCKSMRRVMAKVWGEDGKAFIGQRMTVYRDDKVRFGSDAVGGVRISHMSGIDRETTMALMVTRGKRAPYTVRPLAPERAGRATTVDLPAILAEGRAEAVKGSTALTAWWGGLSNAAKAAAKPTLDGELKAVASKADQAVLDDDGADVPYDADTGEIIESHLSAEDEGEPDDDFPGDRPSATAPVTEPEPFAPKGGNAIAWGKDVLAWLPGATSAKIITEAWAEAKREGKTAALQHADPDLFDAIIDAKERRLDALKGGR